MKLSDEEIIDKVLFRLAEKKRGLFQEDFLSGVEPITCKRIVRRLEREGLVYQGVNSQGSDYYISSRGFQIVDNHGYLIRWKKRQDTKKKRDEQEELNYKNSRYQLLNSKWLYKTRWWPHFMAAAALVISIVGLLISIYHV